MPWKFSYFFHQSVDGGRIGGWTENYWCGVADYESAKQIAGAFNHYLEGVHGENTWVRYIRLSEIGAFRRTKVLFQKTQANENVETGVACDYPTNALLLVLRQENVYVTRQWIRGVPDSEITNGGFYIPTGGFTENWKKMQKFMEKPANNMVMRVLNKDVPERKITSATQAGVVTSAGHGFNNGDVIRISRARGFTELNGIWTVTGVTADTFTLSPWVVPAVAVPLTSNPVAKKREYVLKTPTDIQIEFATKKNVGRPQRLLVGKF